MAIELKPGLAKWEHFGRIKPTLGIIFYDFVQKLKENGITDVCVTSIIRPKVRDTGVHRAGRAIDIRASFSESIGEEVMDYINKKYKYDPERPEIKTCVYHATDNAGDPGWHYHLQVLR